MPKLTLIDGGFPQVQMTLDVKRKMDLIIHSVDTEIGWLGKVERHPNGVFVITDVYVPKQEVNGGTCEITEEGLAELATEIIDKEGIEEANKLRIWGHSHPHFSISPSGQDNQQMKDLFKNVKDYFIRLIANKKGEYNFTIYELDKGLVTEEAEWFQMSDKDDEMEKEIKDIVKKNVKALTYTYQGRGNYGYPDYGGYGGDSFWEWDDSVDHFVKKTKKEDKEANKSPHEKKRTRIGFSNEENNPDPKKDFSARSPNPEGYQYYGSDY